MDNIIELFIKEPEKEFHIREIAKKLKKSPTTISKYLDFYKKKGILKSERKLNYLFFSANEGKNFHTLKLNYNLNLIEDSGVLEFLEEKYFPKAIVLFGSFAKAENILTSDIDFLVISSEKKEINLSSYEKKLKSKIEIHIYSEKDIEAMKVKNKELLNNFVNGIILRGYWELFK